MTDKHKTILGCAMLAIPLGAVLWYLIVTMGWRAALAVLVFCGLIVGGLRLTQ